MSRDWKHLSRVRRKGFPVAGGRRELMRRLVGGRDPFAGKVGSDSQSCRGKKTATMGFRARILGSSPRTLMEGDGKR